MASNNPVAERLINDEQYLQPKDDKTQFRSCYKILHILPYPCAKDTAKIFIVPREIYLKKSP